jgi:hypothetical protein
MGLKITTNRALLLSEKNPKFLDSHKDASQCKDGMNLMISSKKQGKIKSLMNLMICLCRDLWIVNCF